MTTPFPPGDEEAAARAYSRLVARLVRPYYLTGGDRDDLYQEGMIGLLTAIRRYDPGRSDNFEAYAALCIRSRLYDALRLDITARRRAQQTLDGLSAALRPPAADPEALTIASESAREIEAHLHGLLSAFEACVLDPYLEGFTVSEIARRLLRTPKQVENAVARIRRKLAAYLSGENRQ
jgi:RNA polymerase sporulation-specific sigma factor